MKMKMNHIGSYWFSLVGLLETIGKWPRPSAIELYVTFDGITGLQNLVNNENPTKSNKNAQVEKTLKGPFGEPRSSFSSTEFLANYDGVTEMRYSFTISFYWLTAGNVTSGILWAGPGRGTAIRMSFISTFRDFELHAHNASKLGFINPPKAKAKLENVFEPHQWRFLSVAFESNSKTLQIYDETGHVLQRFDHFDLDQVHTERLALGQSADANMDPSTAIACVSVHNFPLKPDEIRQLPCTCQLKGKEIPL